VKRGEIWWAELPRPAGRRPVILLSRDEAYEVRRLVTVAPVTTRIRGIPVEVPLGPKDGLPRECVANLDTVTTIPKDALRERLTVLSRSKMAAVDAALRFALGLQK
jgi:mRNA interferase MazF